MSGMRAANSLLRGNAAAGASLSSSRSRLFTATSPRSTLPTSHTTAASAASAARPAPWHTIPAAATARPFSHTATRGGRKSKKQQRQIEEADEEAEEAAEAEAAEKLRARWPKAAAAPPKPAPAAPADPNRLTADPNHPFDLADLHNNLAKSEAYFTEELKKLRSSGRFNADGLGSLLVQPDRKSGQTFPLRELATVAPLGGRRWSILAFEESSVRAIASAVQRSEAFNQQPQRSADNPLELVMSVEPERGEALARRAREACQEWRTRVREEAHRREKAHKKWRGEGILTADDVVRLKNMVQKVQDDKMKAIQGKEKEVVGAIMSRGS